MALKAFISGCAGTSLTAGERAFFREERPCGLILFARNCETPAQIRELTGSYREAVGADGLLVLIDQEGGRVQRLGPPHWRRYPAARRFADLYIRDATAGSEALRQVTQLMASDLRALGINVDCLPVLDVPEAGAHDVIGDRAYGTEPSIVARLGRVAAEACLAAGVLPVIKHIPGHGRARADSHISLPVIDAALGELEVTDFPPFAALKDMPLAMTAHVLLTALDPERPASVSPVIISDVIRKRIGFQGLLMSDDVSMGALGGGLGDRARAVIASGSDVVLHCNGKMDEMKAVAASSPELADASLQRFADALGRLVEPEVLDVKSAEAALARVMESAGLEGMGA
ncbi:MAG: beta-N-acetylhexosaminidase [Pseudomonadota bacterium]|nr:beta-N-acetylhexosaminidase [Pseudomonadota bacterium]